MCHNTEEEEDLHIDNEICSKGAHPLWAVEGQTQLS